MPGILNRVGMLISTTGQGTVTANVLISDRFLTPAEAGAVNATSYYWLLEDGGDFELFEGTWTLSGTTISRDTVIASKIGGTAGTTKLNLSGAATLRSVAPKEAFVDTSSFVPTSSLGTSGTKIPYLDGGNTWSGIQSFDDGKLALKGSTSGTGTLKAPAAASTYAWTLPAATCTLASLDQTETLSNKTLTAPKIASGGFIADANGNEHLIFTTIASAVNEITYANAATGNNPTITASGETNVGLTITGKGTKGILFGNALGETVVTLTDGATPALDASLGNIFRLSAGGNRTIAVPSNPQTGQKIVIVHYASGADRTLALNTGTNGFRFGTDITALTATTSGKTDYIGAIWNSTDSKWDVVAYAKGY